MADATLIVAAHSEAVSSGYALNQVVSLDECTEDDRSLFESEPLIVPDIRANTPVAAMFRLLAGAEADDDACPRAWLSVPLHVDERLVGILVFGHSEPRYYSPQLVEPICALAGDVGMSIENTLLYDRTALQAERLGTLLAVQRAITSRLELDDVLRMIADEARRLTGSHQGFVMLLEGDDLV